MTGVYNYTSWRCMKLAGLILCLIALFAVCAFPSIAIADEESDLQFEWDEGTRTFTLTYDGTETLTIGSLSFYSYKSAIEATGAEMQDFFYIGSDSNPVEYFVVKGSGPIVINGQLRVVGMKEFDASQGNLVEFTGTIHATSTLETVKFGESLTVLSLGAFAQCSALDSLDLSSTSLTTIYDYPNRGLTGTVTLPATLKSIDRSSGTVVEACGFSNSYVTSVVFDEDTELEYIGPGLFRNATLLKSVQIPASCINLLPENTFDLTYSLETVIVTGTASLAQIEYLQSLVDSNVEIVYEVSVTFDTLGESSVETVTIEAGNCVDEPAVPTRDGYVFDGWYTDEDCTEGNEFDFSQSVTESLTLYAKWVEASQEDEDDLPGAGNPSDTENSGATEDSSDTENSGDEAEDLTDDPDDSSADQEDDATDDDEEDDGALFAVTGDLPQTGDNSLASYGLLSLIATLAACGGVFAYRNSKTTSTRDK